MRGGQCIWVLRRHIARGGGAEIHLEQHEGKHPSIGHVGSPGPGCSSGLFAGAAWGDSDLKRQLDDLRMFDCTAIVDDDARHSLVIALDDLRMYHLLYYDYGS